MSLALITTDTKIDSKIGWIGAQDQRNQRRTHQDMCLLSEGAESQQITPSYSEQGLKTANIFEIGVYYIHSTFIIL